MIYARCPLACPCDGRLRLHAVAFGVDIKLLFAHSDLHARVADGTNVVIDGLHHFFALLVYKPQLAVDAHLAHVGVVLVVARLDGIVFHRTYHCAFHIDDAILLAVAHHGISGMERLHAFESGGAAKFVGLLHIVYRAIGVIDFRLGVFVEDEIAADDRDEYRSDNDEVALQLATIRLLGGLVGRNLCFQFLVKFFRGFLFHIVLC